MEVVPLDLVLAVLYLKKHVAEQYLKILLIFKILDMGDLMMEVLHVVIQSSRLFGFFYLYFFGLEIYLSTVFFQMADDICFIRLDFDKFITVQPATDGGCPDSFL